MKENESKKTKEQTYFSKVWLEDEVFKKCLSFIPQSRCKYCNKTFNLSNMGCQTLVSYATGKKTYNID